MHQQKRHQELCQQIDSLNKSYYVFNETKVPDAIFDQMFKELKEIERDNPSFVTPDSPTQKVGFMAARHFTKAAHPFPMLSLGNTFSASDLIEWVKTIPMQAPTYRERENIIGELKLDGVSLELIYIKGKLNKAITRGNGVVGEDVTLNALGIGGVVCDLGVCYDYPVIVRGEVVVKSKVFNRINDQLAAEGRKTYVNQRNYASGALRQKNPLVTKERELTFIAYSVDFDLPENDSRHIESIEKARWFTHNAGFCNAPTQGFHVDASEEQIQTFLESQEKIRNSDLWEYDIDGLVFKVDSRAVRLEMGFNSREPKWATAYKFPASEGMTILNGITVQVGRTGQLTPVAEVEPVFIHGTTISRVTLHNFDEIARLGVNIGCQVIIKRAGDVIPKIIQTVGETTPYVFNELCPCCGSKAMTVVGKGKPKTTTYFCPNQNCPDRVIGHLAHCAGRGVYNIMDLGIETITNLYTRCGFNSIKDHIRLLILTESELRLAGLSEHQAVKLLANIEKARTLTLDRLLSSFGIDGVSEGTSERLAAKFGTLAKIVDASIEELMETDKVGEITAETIYQFFNKFKADGWYNQYINQLTILNPEPRSELLKGKSVMITGSKFGNLTRKGLTAYYKTLSASVTSSVTSNTHLALFGTSYTGHKLDTAKKLGIPYKIFDDTGVIEDTTSVKF